MVIKEKNKVPIPSTQEAQFIFSLVKRFQYLEALDRFKKLLIKNPILLPDILNKLYKI